MIALRLLVRRLNCTVFCQSRVHVASRVATSLVPTAQHNFKRHGSNGAWSPYYFFSPDLPPIYALQVLLETVHSWSHLPWWTVIIGSTAVLRSIVTVPLAVHQNKLIAEIELRQPTVSMMSEALKHRVAGDSKRKGLSADQADRQFKRQHGRMISDYYKSEGCNPLKMYLLPWTQLPLWFFLSLALRNLSGFFPWQRTADGGVILPSPEIASEGVLWFTNLTLPDPTLIIPFTIGILNFTNIELNALRRHKTTRFQRIITNTLRILCVGMVFVATQVPVAMSLYWSISAFFGLAQNVAFKFPAVRRQLGIPKTPSESEHPIEDLRNLASFKFEEFLRIQREGQTHKKEK